MVDMILFETALRVNAGWQTALAPEGAEPILVRAYGSQIFIRWLATQSAPMKDRKFFLAALREHVPAGARHLGTVQCRDVVTSANDDVFSVFTTQD